MYKASLKNLHYLFKFYNRKAPAPTKIVYLQTWIFNVLLPKFKSHHHQPPATDFRLHILQKKITFQFTSWLREEESNKIMKLSKWRPWVSKQNNNSLVQLWDVNKLQVYRRCFHFLWETVLLKLERSRVRTLITPDTVGDIVIRTHKWTAAFHNFN